MVCPRIFGKRGAQSVIIIRSHARFLFAEADIVIIESVGVGTAGLKHEIIGVIEREAVDEDMSALMTIAVKALDGRSDIATESYAAVCIVNTFARTTGSVAAQLDTITVSGERGRAVEVFLYP